jgi:hypothetical protein
MTTISSTMVKPLLAVVFRFLLDDGDLTSFDFWTRVSINWESALAQQGNGKTHKGGDGSRQQDA